MSVVFLIGFLVMVAVSVMLIIDLKHRNDEIKALKKENECLEKSLNSKLEEIEKLKLENSGILEDLHLMEKKYQIDSGRVMRFLELNNDIIGGRLPTELEHKFVDELRPQLKWIGINFFKTYFQDQLSWILRGSNQNSENGKGVK